MTKVALADVLWDAANVYLRPNSYFSASCCCAFEAEFGFDWDGFFDSWGKAAKASQAVQFLRSLGCRVGSSTAFDRFAFVEERQGARYMWLLLAMHVAEDENILVEVA